ncbi:MAG: serine/threonine-protein kinase [Planctomycetaceae bacterium]
MVRSVHPFPRGLDELGHLLVSLEILRSQQWKSAASGRNSLPALLDNLQTQYAWWDSSQPAITDFQRQCIVARFSQGFRDLDRDLRVNNYLILEKLGSGGMAVVHKCWSIDPGQMVAVKRLESNSQVLRERLEREARILRLLDDPRITQYVAYEPMEDGSGHLLAMEFIDGGTLRDQLKIHSRITPGLAIAWTVELLEALAHAHQAGVIHRDVTPRNIMVLRTVTEEGLPVKLLDFGLGKVTASSLFPVPEISHHGDLTGQSQAIGTFQYMSPEQFRDTASVTGAADIYSLGCSFYEMLAGRPPFIETQFSALLMKHLSALPPDIRLYCPELPDFVADTVMRMLSKNPAERRSAIELKTILLQEAADEIERKFVPEQKERKPGIGLAQAHLSPDPDLRTVDQPLAHPLRDWKYFLFRPSPFVASSRFVDPIPTPLDMTRSLGRGLWYGIIAMTLLAVMKLLASMW